MSRATQGAVDGRCAGPGRAAGELWLLKRGGIQLWLWERGGIQLWLLKRAVIQSKVIVRVT